jgi:hypothetical protein
MTPDDTEVGVCTPGSVVELSHPPRNFNFWSLCGVGLMTGSTWTSLGGAIVRSVPCLLLELTLILTQVIALYNGGPSGVIYELYVENIRIAHTCSV